MRAKLVTSPVQAERPLANRRIRIRGLAKRSRIWRHSGRRRWRSASFGPYLARRRSTSLVLSPSTVVPSSASNRGNGRFQGKVSDIVASSCATPLPEMWAISRRISPWRSLHAPFGRGRAAADGNFDELVLVAPPGVVAELKHSLSKSTAKVVVKELHKDLTKVPDHELTGHLSTSS